MESSWVGLLGNLTLGACHTPTESCVVGHFITRFTAKGFFWSTVWSPLAPKTMKFSKSFKWLALEDGTPGEIRTPDQLVRSQLLYPAELRAHD